MARTVKTWLVCNAMSGGNDEEMVAQLESALAAAGHGPARKISFPDEDAPTVSQLDAAQVKVLAIFAGDGTVHSIVTGLYGWSGAVLVLPGGTMNLLSRRMHGDAAPEEIVGKLARARRVRPRIVRSRHGDALTGVLAGPGAIWNEVREALRAANLVEVVTATREAIAWSTSGPKVICRGVDCGRDDGYAAITVTPDETGLDVKGYYAETLGDYAGQGIALLNRNFRAGPHDQLGTYPEVRLLCPEGEPMGLLMDGEPFDGASEEIFRLATCEVDLLETVDAR